MLRSDSQLILIDFGHAKLVPSAGMQHSASGSRGTQGYVPWNVKDTNNRSAAYDPLKVDVFSLAQTMVAVLFLKMPVNAKMKATATCAQIEKLLADEGDRDSGGVPLDRLRHKNHPPLSDNLRDLLGTMLVQGGGNDDQRPSMQKLLKHAWFNDDSVDSAAVSTDCCVDVASGEVEAHAQSPLTSPKPLGGRKLSGAQMPYQTTLIDEWHVMTAHSPVELIREYPCKMKSFQQTYDVSHPRSLDEDFQRLIQGLGIKKQTLEKARGYGMEYYHSRGARPYVEINSDLLDLLQEKFPNAVPLWNNPAPVVAKQAEVMEFIKSRIDAKKLKPVMYIKPGAFAKRVVPGAGAVLQPVEPPLAPDNPYCFTFEAPWAKNDEQGRDIGPAILDVANGDFLGVLTYPDDPSSDHVWRVPRSWFHGPAASFKLADEDDDLPPSPLPPQKQNTRKDQEEIMGKESGDCGHRLHKASDKQWGQNTAPPSVTSTSCNIQGSRSSNEDYAGSTILTSYVFSYVCDGHAGASIATIIGNTFSLKLEEQLQHASPEASPQALLDFLKTAYNTALDDLETPGNKVKFENHNTGTTITAVLVQRGTNICATLQLGDCRAGVCDATTGALLKGNLLLSEGPDRVANPTSYETLVTREHCFGDSYETQRIKDAIKPHDTWSLATQLRPDAEASECRHTGKLVQDGTDLRFRFNEPARAVENKLMYPPELRETLATAQRTPELQVHQLPTDSNQELLLFCVCDGFFSHNAFPSMEALASCLVDPEAYMAQECLKGTCMVKRLEDKHSQHLLRQAQQWMPRVNNPEWVCDPTKCCYQLMKCLAPDEDWQTAVDISWDSISQLRADHGGRVRTLLETPKAAVEMATNLAVLLMSDDNVSIQALVVQPTTIEG